MLKAIENMTLLKNLTKIDDLNGIHKEKSKINFEMNQNKPTWAQPKVFIIRLFNRFQF